MESTWIFWQLSNSSYWLIHSQCHALSRKTNNILNYNNYFMLFVAVLLLWGTHDFIYTLRGQLAEKHNDYIEDKTQSKTIMPSCHNASILRLMTYHSIGNKCNSWHVLFSKRSSWVLQIFQNMNIIITAIYQLTNNLKPKRHCKRIYF